MGQIDLSATLPPGPHPCPVCGGGQSTPTASVAGRDYLRCADCHLSFMLPAHRLSCESERAYYRLHQNDPADAGYRRFLSKLADPLIRSLPPGARGLDYGCGPGPTLSVMLGEAGFAVRDYDPCFVPDEAALLDTYDFITCTETVEHFHRPSHEFARLDELLKPGGCLAVMTETLESAPAFGRWWYVRDPTHVCFYATETMRWIANSRSWRMVGPARNVTFFLKPEVTEPS